MNERYDVVVPTVGRPSLAATLAALGADDGPLPERVIVVDDRRGWGMPLARRPPRALTGRVEVVSSGGRGPAAARNAGWRAARSPWVVFLDDDVEPLGGWRAALAGDLADLPDEVAASAAVIEVPLPAERRPTDWERNVAGLARARWVTADMAYRRDALERLGGFDESFPRAYREDADLAARARAAGYELRSGRRRVSHPVRPAPWWVSLKLQAGNADDALLRRRYGRRWRVHTAVPPGRFPRHVAITLAGLSAVAAVTQGRRSLGTAAGLLWLAGTTEFAAARIRPGPRTPGEIAAMVVTSAAIPPLACWHRLRGWVHARRVEPARRPAAVLFDRDGTLVEDVPYNGDPGQVRPRPLVREALDRLRVAGIPTAVISNQSGVARGLITREQVEGVNRRIEELLGPLGPWVVCHHGDGDGCECRKPAPGLVRSAASTLGVDPRACVVVGDIGADI
jgi:HAD superfamily hydrolase (TIGR01662 family)